MKLLLSVLFIFIGGCKTIETSISVELDTQIDHYTSSKVVIGMKGITGHTLDGRK